MSWSFFVWICIFLKGGDHRVWMLFFRLSWVLWLSLTHLLMFFMAGFSECSLRFISLSLQSVVCLHVSISLYTACLTFIVSRPVHVVFSFLISQTSFRPVVCSLISSVYLCRQSPSAHCLVVHSRCVCFLVWVLPNLPHSQIVASRLISAAFSEILQISE